MLLLNLILLIDVTFSTPTPVINIYVLLQTNSNPDLALHLAQTERRAMPEVQNVADTLRIQSELAPPEFVRE